jgi:hypothetical protein
LILFVAVLLPFSDGSGKTKVLGVYTLKHFAEARCHRAIKAQGYDQPTEIIECFLNIDRWSYDQI